MRILLVTQYFPPENGAPQARLSELAGAWAAAGDEVTVLTGMPSHPTGIRPPAYRHAVRRRERRAGYQVVRTWLYATPAMSIARKTVSQLSFMCTSALLGWRASGKADTVVVSSPAFFSIASAWLLARLKRARLVVEIRDLWPAILVESGVLTNRKLIWLLERLELAAYAAADEVVVVSDGFRASLVERGVPAAKVHTIRDGATAALFDPARPPDPFLRAGLGARPGECLVLYAGTHGISQGLPEAAEAATRLTGRPVHLAFVGEGADKPRLAHRVTELNLTNVTLAKAIPSAMMPALLASADILLVTLRDAPLLAAYVPAKIFEYLAAGRPVIGAVTGEAARVLREAGAMVVPPGDSAALASAIAGLSADPRERAVLAARGRAYVERFFDRADLARQYRKILDGRPGDPAPATGIAQPVPGARPAPEADGDLQEPAIPETRASPEAPAGRGAQAVTDGQAGTGGQQ
jgi:hypothetical protein